MNSLGIKAALVCATTAVSVLMFAGTAFAAPQLAAGQTSGGPHDSRGNCASCHSYPAAAPTPAPAPTPTTPDVTTPSTGTGTGTAIGTTTPGSVTITVGGVTIVISTPYGATQPAQTVTPAPTTNTPSVPSNNNNQGDDEGSDD